MEETPFYVVRLDREALREHRAGLERVDPEVRARSRRIFKFSGHYGCYPFGRLDAAQVRREGPIAPTLLRTCAAAAATQRGYDFTPVCYVFPATVDIWLQAQHAALLSRDGRVGLLIQHYVRDRAEELFYSCTSALEDGIWAVTRCTPPDLFDPPATRVEAAPSATLKDTLAHHAARIAALPVRPFRAAEVAGVILEINRAYFDFNVAAGRFVPLPARDLAAVRAGMRGWPLKNALLG